MKTSPLPLLFLLTLSLLALSSCTTPGAALDIAEQQWRKESISHYKIEVLVVNSIWHAQTHTITVQNGEVVDADATCIPAPFESGTCQATPFVAEEYTVPGLFAKARAETEKEETSHLTITYDPTHHFPASIAFDDPEIVDEDWIWRVTSFEVFP